MRYAVFIALVVFTTFWVGCGNAWADDAVTVREAQRTVNKLERRLVVARLVLRHTKLYSERYGQRVGRWVWLANDTRWPRDAWGNLFYVINRESGGNPDISNYQGSGASGLLQLMPGWYHGEWGYPAFNPFNPRANLKCGRWLYMREGWTPWGM